MENQAVPRVPMQVPTFHHLRCPHCGGDHFRILGKKGAQAKAIGVGAAFGAIGAVVAASMSENEFDLAPINFKCLGCKKKFESLPHVATADEFLPAPCKIIFKRMNSFVGIAVSQAVWLNGIKISPIGNDQTIEFFTYIKDNTLFVTDQFGVAFKESYQFQAQPGGCVQVFFNRKFQNK